MNKRPDPYGDALAFIPGNKLRELRHARGISQQQLAGATGVSLARLRHCENGALSMKIEEMRAFAGALGCNTADVLAADDKASLSRNERELIARYRLATPGQRGMLDRFAAGAPLPANEL